MPRAFANSPLFLAALAVALGTALPRPAAADAIISMNGTVNTSGTPAADASPATRNSYIAAGFTINTGSNYTFSQAIAYGIESSGAGIGGSAIYSTGSLWMGDGGSPATFLQNLSASTSRTIAS